MIKKGVKRSLKWYKTKVYESLFTKSFGSFFTCENWKLCIENTPAISWLKNLRKEVEFGLVFIGKTEAFLKKMGTMVHKLRKDVGRTLAHAHSCYDSNICIKNVHVSNIIMHANKHVVTYFNFCRQN